MFRDILLELMAEKRIKQIDLSKATGIPPTTVSGWLNAGRLPDYHALRKLSLYFEISADYLLGLKEYD